MQLIKITVDQLRNDETRNYNPQVWNQKIDMLLKMSDVQFYKMPAGNGYSYDRFYATYQIPEGIRILNDFGYSSCLSNSTFGVVNIAEDGTLTVTPLTVNDNGKQIGTGRVQNNKAGRALMARKSISEGLIFTNNF